MAFIHYGWILLIAYLVYFINSHNYFRFSCTITQTIFMRALKFFKLFRFTLSAHFAGLPNKLHQFPVLLWVSWTLTQWMQAEIEFCTFWKSTDERLNEKCDAEVLYFRLNQGKLRKCLQGISGLDCKRERKSFHNIPLLLSATVAMREAVKCVRLRKAFIILVWTFLLEEHFRPANR